MKIEKGKKYRLRDCPESEVVILDTELDPPYTVAAKLKRAPHREWEIMTFSSTGEFDTMKEYGNGNDLIEVSPYADFKVDEPVMVSDGDLPYRRRYFAGIGPDGIPRAWDAGATSWTTDVSIAWNYCRRPAPEEIHPWCPAPISENSPCGATS